MKSNDRISYQQKTMRHSTQSDSFSILFWPRIKVHFKGCLVIRKVRKRLLGFPFGKSWNWMSLSLKRCICDFMITASQTHFSYLRFFYNFLAVCLQFCEKYATFQTYFGFMNLASEMHCFRAMTINFWLFPEGSTYTFMKCWN